MRPIHSSAATDARLEGGNRGLWYTRFFDRYSDDGTLDEDAKRSWVSDNARPTGDRALLAQAVDRQRNLVAATGGRTRTFASDWHFATGLGLPHPVENGLNWHSTLGVPYLPGSGVKGLVRAWVECWDESLGAPDSRERANRISDWFGTINDRDGSGTAGRFVFFDALPVAPVQLAADVMTPHLGKWYEQGGELGSLNEAERIPADWHDPVPVPFLVVKSACMQFGIAPRPGQSGEGLDEVMQALEQALAWLGAGAKTAVGYGRFVPTDEQTDESVRGGLVAPETVVIKSGTETWADALLEWDGGGSGKLTATDPSNPKRRAVLIGADAKALHAGLSAGQIKKLKNRTLRRSVEIEILGNQITIRCWTPAATP